eukprot:TRINITY_DN884_c0_g3_i1.p1 TRINITY_DN884_c0_g3~~TRINITY_DN884_c0_g3_i1.p1  ORF type:complete len:494 (-),score=218.97 TRINITY_DN884_c0_g3_i1:773-2209(-)
MAIDVGHNFFTTKEILGINLSILIALFVASLSFFFVFYSKFFKKRTPKIDEQEFERKLGEWNPEPLEKPLTELQVLNIQSPLVESGPTAEITINGKKAMNLVTLNYLGLIDNKEIEEAALAALNKYGCGSCGPRGFYGTIDVHLILEDRLKKFMQTDDAIIYSSGFATLTSIIPAFSKRGDFIFCDENVNFGLKLGTELSRSTVTFFKHNDIDQLSQILEDVKREDKRTKRKLNRRFLIIEGVYQNTGTIAHLDKIMQLKERHLFRIIMDDSNGIGILGATGRGTCEHFNIPTTSIEVIFSTMGNTLASVGGMCCGNKVLIDHQRLNSSGYVFSASLPPYLATAATASIDLIDNNPNLCAKVRQNAKAFRETWGKIKRFELIGDDIIPLIHIRFTEKIDPNDSTARLRQEKILQQIVDKVLNEHSIAITRAKYVANEKSPPPPSLVISVSAMHSTPRIVEAANIIKRVASEVSRGQKI